MTENELNVLMATVPAEYARLWRVALAAGKPFPRDDVREILLYEFGFVEKAELERLYAIDEANRVAADATRQKFADMGEGIKMLAELFR